MNAKKQLANYLRKRLKCSELSQDEFAKQLDIAKSSLTLYLKEIGNPRLDTVEILTDKLDLKLILIPKSKTKLHPEIQRIADDAMALLMEISEQIYKINPD